jgi:hypothetical protein
MTEPAIELHCRRLRPSGATLAVVMVGDDVFAAVDTVREKACDAAMRKASAFLMSKREIVRAPHPK